MLGANFVGCQPYIVNYFLGASHISIMAGRVLVVADGGELGMSDWPWECVILAVRVSSGVRRDGVGARNEGIVLGASHISIMADRVSVVAVEGRVGDE